VSGHSKWSTIKRQKGVADAKRGALFTKLGNQIAIAARSGTDPKSNPSLAMVIEKAKKASMPLSNIERSIARVKDKSAAQLEELRRGYLVRHRIGRLCVQPGRGEVAAAGHRSVSQSRGRSEGLGAFAQRELSRDASVKPLA